MERNSAYTAARVLRVLVVIAFACCVAVMVLAPALAPARAVLRHTSLTVSDLLDSLTAEPPPPGDNWWFSPGAVLLFMVAGGWIEYFGYSLVLTFFLLTVGLCAAVVLWEARRVLGTVCRQEPFCSANVHSLRRAAACCFVISAAALARVVWELCYYQSPQPLLSYTALFVPAFLLGGLLLRLMAALFRGAAELKAENDLIV